MDAREETASILVALSEGRLPPPEVVATMLSNATIRHRVLMDPALADALSECASEISGLTCDDVSGDLAGFIAAEQIILSDLVAYDNLQLHLHECPGCLEEYYLAREINSAQENGLIPQWPNHTVPPPASDAIRLNLPIVLPRAEFLHSLQQWQVAPTPMRGPDDDAALHLLYAGRVPGQPDLFARITLARPMDLGIDEWQIRVALLGRPSLAGLVVVLHWGDEQREATTNEQGEAHFPRIPATWITSPTGPDVFVTVGEAID